jgi:hypothetical protein
MDAPVRWTVRVSKDTDVAVRTFLAQRGMKKGDLAKSIEEAMRWRVLDRTVAKTKARNAKAPMAEMRPQSMKRSKRCAPSASLSADEGRPRHQHTL